MRSGAKSPASVHEGLERYSSGKRLKYELWIPRVGTHLPMRFLGTDPAGYGERRYTGNCRSAARGSVARIDEKRRVLAARASGAGSTSSSQMAQRSDVACCTPKFRARPDPRRCRSVTTRSGIPFPSYELRRSAVWSVDPSLTTTISRSGLYREASRVSRHQRSGFRRHSDVAGSYGQRLYVAITALTFLGTSSFSNTVSSTDGERRGSSRNLRSSAALVL